MPLETICLEKTDRTLVEGDRPLSINAVVNAARHGKVFVRITDAPNIQGGVQASGNYIQNTAKRLCFILEALAKKKAAWQRYCQRKQEIATNVSNCTYYWSIERVLPFLR